MVLSQTTLTPAVTDTTLSENVPTLTVTPVILSSTTPGCSEFNTSTCEPCGPGSQYDNTLLCLCCTDPGLCLFPGACLPCNRGFYQPLSGQQQCWPCDRGFYTVTGSPLCNPCPSGSFNNNTGGDGCTSCSPSSRCSQCQTCPGGTEALQAAAKGCTRCRPMHKPPHQTFCQICGSGFYQIHWGQESCDVCPENHYCPSQSPDVKPIRCPNDAFCPEGSSAPSYCMETFFRKAGDTCEFAPVTIALLVIAGGALLFIILMVLRRWRDAGGQVGVARAPLLHKERPQGRYYGIACDAEPVYAGW
uniref:Tyrosine-protein kinase ephrin type A/B receptor-like domain-containing protein n=1 Tax=Mola mola TaxID=94237 RepID=A0A3Q4BGA8_MOLML